MATATQPRYHTNPKTGKSGKCDAKIKCDFQKEGGPEVPHFATLAEAEAHGQKIMSENHGLFAVKKKRHKAVAVDATHATFGKGSMSKEEAALKAQIVNMAQSFVTYRAESAEDLLLDPQKGDADRAEDVMVNAINFAASRGNTHLAEKIAKSRMLPTSAIETKDGDKFYTEDLIATDTAVKTLAENREKINAAMVAIGQDAPAGKYTLKDKVGSFSVTVADEALDEDFYNSLSEDKRKLISKEEPYIDIDLARERLTEQQLNKIMTQSQVLDYLSGKPRNIGQKSVKARTNLVGNTPEEKLNDGLKAVSDLFASSKDTFGGRHTDMKKKKDDMAEKVKSSALVKGTHVNTLIPGRSRQNAIIVTGRGNISRTLAQQVLDAETLAKISTKKYTADKDLAKQHLTPEEFGKMFGAKKVTFYAREA